MIAIKDNKILGKVIDEDSGICLIMVSISKDDAEKVFKRKFWEAFEKGAILIGYDSERKSLVTIPSVSDLVSRGLV
ncbi:MAG: hypothetical protein QW734_06520 [Candidatus Bathyarchaeia archaeon]